MDGSSAPVTQPQIDILMAQIAALQAENQALRIQQQQNTTVVHAHVRLPPPDTFDPTDAKKPVRTWLFQLATYFTATGLIEDLARINLAVTLFRGPALEWWRQYQFAVTSGDEQMPTTWPDFEQLLRSRFELVTATKAARMRLRHFRQIGTVADYTSRFLAIAAEIDDLSNAEKCDRYLTGLRQDIAELVALQQLPDNDFSALVSAAERIDQVKQQQRRKGTVVRPAIFSSRPIASSFPVPATATPMDLDGLNEKKDPRVFRARPPRCFVCGNTGHLARECEQNVNSRRQVPPKNGTRQ
jgi:hypothetical protein